MLAKAKARSSSDTSVTWSNRATALRTCFASVIGSLRWFGNAKTVSGKSPLAVSSPCFSWGFQVACIGNSSLSRWPRVRPAPRAPAAKTQYEPLLFRKRNGRRLTAGGAGRQIFDPACRPAIEGKRRDQAADRREAHPIAGRGLVAGVGDEPGRDQKRRAAKRGRQAIGK